MWSYCGHFQLHKCKIIVAYRTLSHILAIEIGPWSVMSISRDDNLCHPCSYDVVENEAHFEIECPPPLYNSIDYKFQSLFF